MIVEALEGLGTRSRSRCRRCSSRSHGPVRLGGGRGRAVENAIALEAVAAMAIDSLTLAPELPPIAGDVAREALPRKHGAGCLLRAGRRSVSPGGGSGHYAIGIDFGTESGRAVLVDCADGRELGTAVHAYANGVIDERLPAPDEDVTLEAGLGAPGPRGLPRRLPGGCARAPRRDRRRPGRGDRRRHRLHVLHDAPDHAPTGLRSAVFPACGGIRTRGSSCGSTTPRSRRRT